MKTLKVLFILIVLAIPAPMLFAQTQPAYETMFIPQIVVGKNWTTAITATCRSDSPLPYSGAHFTFFKQDSQTMIVSVGHNTTTTKQDLWNAHIDLIPRMSRTIYLSPCRECGDRTMVGYSKVVIYTGVDVSVVLQMWDDDHREVIASVGVLPVKTNLNHSTYATITPSADLGLAIANPNSSETLCIVRAYYVGDLVAERIIVIPMGGQTAKYLSEILIGKELDEFGNLLTDSYIEITATRPVAVLGLALNFGPGWFRCANQLVFPLSGIK